MTLAGTRRVLAAVAAATVCAVAPASAAWAHGADSPAGTNYRTEITGVHPPLPGVRVRLIEAGTALELTTVGDQPVRVLGYAGEPYLEVRPDGVYENARSSAAALEPDPAGTMAGPASADPNGPPRWRRVAGGTVARWYDQRMTWDRARPVGSGSPRVRAWTVPLAMGQATASVTGVVERMPAPSPWPWCASVGVATAALAALGLAGHTRGGRAGLGATAVVAGSVALGYATAREVDAGARSPAEVLGWLLTGRVWLTLSAVTAVAVGTWLLARAARPGRRAEDAGLFLLVLAGTCLVLFGGLADAPVLARAVAPVPFDAVWARLAVTAVLAGSAGILAGGVVALRRLRVTGQDVTGQDAAAAG